MPCTKEQSFIKFKVSEKFGQEVKVREGEKDEVMPPVNMDKTTLSYAGTSTVTYSSSARLPPTSGEMPDTDFDSIWRAVFTLDPKVLVKKQIIYADAKESDEE